MSAFGSRQSSSSFIRIGELECGKSPTGSLKNHGEGIRKRWSRRLQLRQLGGSNQTKGYSFIKKFRHSFNAKFTILSIIFLVLLMSGSAAAIPVDPSSTASSDASATSPDSAATETGVTVELTGTVETPTLFDTVTISSNSTTTTCPAFFATFLRDPDFSNCLPLSALLLNSQSYFEITMDGAFPTTQTIDKTCNVDIKKCQGVMDKLGRQITMDENCGLDFRLGNPIVTQAYAAFIAYKPIYTASCLKSNSGSYCYVDAMTNTSSPSDSYPYYIPLGRNLPGGSRLTCSACLQKTMVIFSTFAGNKTQPLFNTYVQAAQQIGIGCGPNFVSTSVEMYTGASGKTSPAILPVLMSTMLLVIGAAIAM